MTNSCNDNVITVRDKKHASVSTHLSWSSAQLTRLFEYNVKVVQFRTDDSLRQLLRIAKEWGVPIKSSSICREALKEEIRRVFKENKSVLLDRYIQDIFDSESLSNLTLEQKYEELSSNTRVFAVKFSQLFGVQVSSTEIKGRLSFIYFNMINAPIRANKQSKPITEKENEDVDSILLATPPKE